MKMQKQIKKTAKRVLGRKLYKKMDFNLLLYGVAAYYGIKFLNSRGYLPTEASGLFETVERRVSDFIEGVMPEHHEREVKQAEVTH